MSRKQKCSLLFFTDFIRRSRGGIHAYKYTVYRIPETTF